MIAACDANLSGPSWAPRAGTITDIEAIKAIADREKQALGFVHRGSLVRAAARDELIVASIGSAVAGFCQIYRRRDGLVTVYHVAVVPEARGAGIGRALLTHVAQDAADRGLAAVRLKCPAELPANGFYARIGFRLVTREAGRGRPLNVWECRIANARDADRPSPTPPTCERG